MTHRFKAALLGASALTVLVGAGQSVASEFTADQKDEIGALVREYILENPGIIFEAADRHRANEEQAQADKAKAKIEEMSNELANNTSMSFGNMDGDITIVEFFDYNCGYCKKALPDLQKVVDADPNVKIVLKEMPILGPTSRTAALWAAAAAKQDKYFDYHVALMEFRGPKEEAELEKLAKDVGLDVEQLKKDAASSEIAKIVDDSIALGGEIGVRGTPAFIIGTQFVPGYIDANALKAKVAEEREKAKQDG